MCAAFANVLPTSFAASDIGKPGVPALTTQQQRTVLQIVNRAPKEIRWRLRFAITGAEGYPHNQLVVLDPGLARPDGSFSSSRNSDAYQCFKVIGTSNCNTEFNPRHDFIFTATIC
jgi:hypothetical protein